MSAVGTIRAQRQRASGSDPEKRCTRLQFSCTRQSNLKSYERYLLSGTSGTFTYVHSGSDEGERNRESQGRPAEMYRGAFQADGVCCCQTKTFF